MLMAASLSFKSFSLALAALGFTGVAPPSGGARVVPLPAVIPVVAAEDTIDPLTLTRAHDGLFYVKESAAAFGTEKLFDGKSNPAGAAGMARIPDGALESVIEAAEECPGECIFIEVE